MTSGFEIFENVVEIHQEIQAEDLSTKEEKMGNISLTLTPRTGTGVNMPFNSVTKLAIFSVAIKMGIRLIFGLKKQLEKFHLFTHSYD